MKKHKFQKMWGAHTMGVLWGEVVASNFSVNNPYKEEAGLKESNVIFYFDKKTGTEFFNSVSEMEESSKYGFDRFTNDSKSKSYITNTRKIIEKAKAFYLRKLDQDLSKLSAKTLLKEIESCLDNFTKIYSFYHACQPQYFSLIENKIHNYLKEKTKNVDEGISLLTSVNDIDIITRQEIEWLELVKDIKKDCSDIKNLNNDIISRIKKHSEIYQSFGSGEGGKAWDLNYFLDLLKKDILLDVEEKISSIEQKKREALSKRSVFLDRYKISEEINKISKTLGLIGNIRLETRLGWMMLSHISSIFINELAKRKIGCLNPSNILDFTLKEIKNIILKKGKFDCNKLSERSKAYIFVIKDGLLSVVFGDEAFVIRNNLIKVTNTNVKEIRGIVACKGHVSGKAFVIDWNDKKLSQTMDKMKDGMILVAGQTRPFLIPAIKKAGAIITDEGGITSHASIVSRELGIPCIIGTKIATQVLKDGDMVEVDANSGVVRIIDRAHGK